MRCLMCLGMSGSARRVTVCARAASADTVIDDRIELVAIGDHACRGDGADRAGPDVHHAEPAAGSGRSGVRVNDRLRRQKLEVEIRDRDRSGPTGDRVLG